MFTVTAVFCFVCLKSNHLPFPLNMQDHEAITNMCHVCSRQVRQKTESVTELGRVG